MNYLQSITPITKKYATQGSRPVVVMANDLESYVTKYPFYAGDFRLINEYLGTSFAKLWGIACPTMSVINVSKAHIPDSILGNQLTYSSFELPVLGYQMLPSVLDLNRFATEMDKAQFDKLDKKALLTIALFDLWLANEDRNQNNLNLLLKSENNRSLPIAIDHEKIFNTGDLTRDIYELTYTDSLFYSGLFQRMFRDSKHSSRLFDEIVSSLGDKIHACDTHLADILFSIPPEWNINAEILESKLHQNIFTDQWAKITEQVFREYAYRCMKEQP